MTRMNDSSFRRPPDLVYQSYLHYMDNVVASKKITPEEKNLIQLFISEAGGMREITSQRKYAIGISLVNFREYITDYRTCTTSEVFMAIEKYRIHSGHSASYQNVALSTCKRFLLWLHESGHNTELNPTKISKLHLKLPTALKTVDDILTADELQRIFK